MIDLDKLAIAMQTKRGRRSLREVAEEIPGVHLSTLNRIENRKSKPDLDTFVAICNWLDVPMDFFSAEGNQPRKCAA